MDTTKAKIEVMNHFVNGGEIEWMLKDDPQAIWTKWPFPGAPSWNWEKCDYRILKSPKFRLPTKKEFESLIKNFARWNENNRTLEILSNSLSILAFPAFPPIPSYYNNNENDNGTEVYGNYWSSTIEDGLNNNAYLFTFDPSRKFVDVASRNCVCNVRLVSDEPFDGGIEFGGIYWKPENEEGHYNFWAATEKFNK